MNPTATKTVPTRAARIHSQQLALFRHLAGLLKNLSAGIQETSLTPPERRAFQRELAGLKKSAQAARHRLSKSRR